MQLVWDMLWDPKTSIFCDTPGLKFDKTPRGYLPKFRPSIISAKPASFAIRGEYDPTLTYNLYDLVVVTTGANVGTYVCVSSVGATGQNPWAGNNFWMQLPMGTTTGVWM